MERTTRRPLGIRFLASVVFLVAAMLPAAAGSTAYDKGMLWRISAPGIPASYVFGTFHSAEPTLATLSPALQKVLGQVDRVMIEVVSSPETTREMATAVLLTDGRRLSDIVGPDRFRRVVEAGARYGIPAENLDLLQPWGVMGILSIPVSELKRQAQGQTLDRLIESTATERGIPVLGIETADEQLAALSGNSEADQLAMLDAVLDQGPRIEDSFEQLRQAYLAGDLGRLNELAMQDAGSTPPEVVERYYRRLLQDRNYRMAERIGPHIANGNTLVAVGALHLHGDEGLPALLARAGYDVSPVQ